MKKKQMEQILLNVQNFPGAWEWNFIKKAPHLPACLRHRIKKTA